MIPLFKSNHSILKSILTIDPPNKNYDPAKSDSIFDIAIENNLDEIFLVEDTLSSLLPAFSESAKIGKKLCFGYRVSFVSDSSDKTDESINTSHKGIIVPKNEKGYHELIKLGTLAAFDNFYKGARLSYQDLHNSWSDNLKLAIPFYDSFLHMNLLHGGFCVPDFRDIKPTVFIESNQLPFDYILEEASLKYAEDNNLPVEMVKSIYYKNREDFEAYTTFKCLNRKAFGAGRTLDNPGFDHLSSREFSWESYLENTK